MKKLGIALVTYQRFERARQVIGRIIEYTQSPIELVVAEDGGSDETRDWFRRIGVTVISGPNRGVCWNKNRGLYALLARGCETLLLLEDDIYPDCIGWERDWATATERYDHLAFAHEKIAGEIISGAGTPHDPYVNNKATAQCTAVSARALREVGFLDTRFRGYGVGHAEWTSRMKQAGFGFKRVVLPDGRKSRANLYISGGLVAEDAASFRDNATVTANRALFQRLKGEPLFRWPWSNADERDGFMEEQTRDNAGIAALPEDFFSPLGEKGRSRPVAEFGLNQDATAD